MLFPYAKIANLAREIKLNILTTTDNFDLECSTKQ